MLFRSIDNGRNNRFSLINELISENYDDYHKTLYQYHRLGLDQMSSNEKQAKETIQNAILLLDRIPSLRLNSYAMTLFFNAKTEDRKSTRLNSSHGSISYAVFCLKKKKTKNLYFNSL